jgi:hypothetical protein
MTEKGCKPIFSHLLRIYENQYHGASRFSDEIASISADWQRDRLNGKAP